MERIIEDLSEEGFNLEIKTDDISEYCCICNPSLLSRGLEDLSYGIVDDSDGVYGFFITKDDIVYASCVVDLNCNAVCTKLEMEVESYKNKVFQDYAEVTLLCSNFKHRVPGIASKLLNYVKLWVATKGKKYLVLTVANINKNASAVRFYENQEFEQIESSAHFVYFIK